MGGITAHRRPLAVIGLALTFALASAACTSEAEPTPSPKHNVELLNEGRLTVCTQLPYAPFQFRQKGKVVGFDVEILDLVAKELGVTQEIVDTPWEDITSGKGVKSERCDVAMAAITITDDRAKHMDFSDGYFAANQAMLVKAGKPYKELKDLKGKKVGVQGETTGAAYVQAEQKKQKLTFKVVEYEDFDGQQHALQTGQIDAAINDLPVWTEYLRVERHQGKYEITAEFVTDEKYGVAVKQGNSKLLKVINDVLADARADGRYDRVYEKWFGMRPDA
ncbi:MAG: transporter substrate-binding domain-containing protein [Micromonosporaceae bacterium]|nr:transporter substrate-binding domain-containing protein [Micromonosporaceae bacterium]